MPSAELSVTVNRSEPTSFFEGIRELWSYRALIVELVKRDLRNRYKNSVGGVLWSMVPPVIQIIVITFMVRYVWKLPVTNYHAYLFGVLFLWTFFQASLMDGSVSLITNADLIRKVYLPRAIFPLLAMIGSLVHFSIGLLITLIYFFVRGIYPEHLHPKLLLIFPVIFFMVLLGLGMALILSYSTVFYGDVQFIMTTLMGLAMYAIPIYYPIESVAGNPLIYRIYMLNPLAAFVVTYQRALLPPPGSGPLADIPWLYFGIACCVSFALLVFGFSCFERNQWDVVERL